MKTQKEIKDSGFFRDDVYTTSIGGSGGTGIGSTSFRGYAIGAGGNSSSIISNGTYTTGISVDLSGNKDFNEVTDRLTEIEKRLAILVPNKDLQDRFPALQEAYDHYKLIEKLVNDSVKIK